MRGLLADINAVGALTCLRFIWLSAAWREFWVELGLSIKDFQALGLPVEAPDQMVWRTCQREQLILITGNRNKHGADSLEATIQSENQPDSLPVITIADLDRVVWDRLYAETVAERLLDYLMRIDEVRGVGRIYVP
jgi:hypothetical protein